MDICFVNENKGWAVGNDAFLATTDGGRTWINQTFTAGIPYWARNFFEIQFLNENVGYIAASCGRVLCTKDGGATWNESVVLNDTLTVIRDIDFLDPDTGWAYVHDISARYINKIYHTTDGGKTCDGGKTWKEQFLFDNFINDFAFLNERTGWALQGPSYTTIMRTDNGGDTWREIAQFKYSNVCNKLIIISPDTLWVVGPYFSISTDGGYTWNETKDQMRDIFIKTRLQYWSRYFDYTRNASIVNYTENGGINFHELLNEPSIDVVEMSGLRNGMLWVACHDGKIMKYTPESMNVSENLIIPKSFELFQNSPNPFNAQITIHFSNSSRERIKLSIYDVTGKLIRTLCDSMYPPGLHSIIWDGHDSLGKAVASGLFFCRLSGNFYDATNKMVMLK